jgi:hypothetical protein
VPYSVSFGNLVKLHAVCVCAFKEGTFKPLPLRNHIAFGYWRWKGLTRRMKLGTKQQRSEHPPSQSKTLLLGPPNFQPGYDHRVGG